MGFRAFFTYTSFDSLQFDSKKYVECVAAGWETIAFFVQKDNDDNVYSINFRVYSGFEF